MTEAMRILPRLPGGRLPAAGTVLATGALEAVLATETILTSETVKTLRRAKSSAKSAAKASAEQDAQTRRIGLVLVLVLLIPGRRLSRIKFRNLQLFQFFFEMIHFHSLRIIKLSDAGEIPLPSTNYTFKL